MSFLSDAFGRALRLRRKQLRLTQSAAAERMETEAPTISRWENGQFIPADATLDLILEKFDINGDAFLTMMSGAEDSGAAQESIDEKILEAIERGAALHASKQSAPQLSKRLQRLMARLERASDNELEFIESFLSLPIEEQTELESSSLVRRSSKS